jgi:hypothetical protein
VQDVRRDAGKKVSWGLCGLERICAEVPLQAHLDSAGLAGAIRLLEGGRLALAGGIPNAQGTYDHNQPGFFLPSDGHVRLSSPRSLAVPPPDQVRGRLLPSASTYVSVYVHSQGSS